MLTLLRVRALWLSPLILGGIVVTLMTLTYIGALKNPVAQLHDLPVAVVDLDAGASGPGGEVNLGSQVSEALTRSKAVTGRLAVASLDRHAASRRLDEAEIYVAVVIPADFTRQLLAAGTSPSAAPQVQLVTNPRLGSAGVGLATGVVTPALAAASQSIAAALATPQPQAFAVVTSQYRPLPPNSALGLSAFYLALLATMCGFLGATIVNSTVDSGLGYATTETGSKLRQRVPVPISRWHTLEIKWAIGAVIPPALVAIVLIVAVGVLRLDAPDVGYLWAMMSLGALAVTAGTLTLFAALGSLGQLLALILFVYLALASAGATVPSEALPQPFAAISAVDPLRRLFAGVRSIIYFDGRASDGWPQAVLVLAIEVLFWLALGALITRWYDRRGLNRLAPELIAYITRSAAAYRDGSAANAGQTSEDASASEDAGGDPPHSPDPA